MKIGIADPQARVRFSLRILLEQQPGWIIGGEAVDCQELFDLLRGVSLDLLLMVLQSLAQQSAVATSASSSIRMCC